MWFLFLRILFLVVIDYQDIILVLLKVIIISVNRRFITDLHFLILVNLIIQMIVLNEPNILVTDKYIINQLFQLFTKTVISFILIVAQFCHILLHLFLHVIFDLSVDIFLYLILSSINSLYYSFDLLDSLLLFDCKLHDHSPDQLVGLHYIRLHITLYLLYLMYHVLIIFIELVVTIHLIHTVFTFDQ